MKPSLGEYGSISFFLSHEMFIKAPGLISVMFSTAAKSPLRLFLIIRFNFSLSQMKFVFKVKNMNIDVNSE